MFSLGKSISDSGEFKRKDSVFRRFVTADGSSGFPAEAGRYHLYASLACPWACRVIMMRMLKGLEDVMDVTFVDWLLTDKSWSFTDKKPRCSLDHVNNKDYLSEIYKMVDHDYSGRFTVPVLWDKQTKTIVNNESAEIVRMLNTEFNAFCSSDAARALDFYPSELRPKIEELNAWIYPMINNGVYRAGFATSQQAYEEAAKGVFEGLDRAEAILSKSRFLTGNQFTEADIRLFTTLVRFDPVYVGHFKCNKKRLVDYQNLWAYSREIYQMPGVRDSVDFEHIAKHYQMSQRQINPYGIVTLGPDMDWEEPHGRESVG